MKSFLARHAKQITGVLSGFDRIVIRGVLRQLSHVEGLMAFLSYRDVLLRDFGKFAESMTAKVVAMSEAVAKTAGRPFRYLSSSTARKEDIARELLAGHPTKSGLICILKCVEPCQSFEIRRSREHRKLLLRSTRRKCAHLYHYLLHPRFGFMHVRVQTWLPFQVQVVLNGREWLARDLDREGLEYRRHDNCIAAVADPDRAQRLLDKQLRSHWPEDMDRLALLDDPAHPVLFGGDHMPRYWSTHQVEWATDVLFASSQYLPALYPDLTMHAIRHLGCTDILRFLQKKLTPHFLGDVTSDYKQRSEGVRVKHFVNCNSLKMYDKHPNVLRIETTLNNVRDLKVYRPKEGDRGGTLSWRPCRKGVADLHRATQAAQKANEAYLEAIAAVRPESKLGDLLRKLVKPATINHQRVRGLQPWSPHDLQLLQAVSRGEFLLNGFRNRDIRAQLYPKSVRAAQATSASARVGRLLRLLRAHKIIRKLPHTHRYKVTNTGRQVIAAVVAAHSARVSALLEAA